MKTFEKKWTSLMKKPSLTLSSFIIIFLFIFTFSYAEEKNVIKGYRINLSKEQLGFGVTVFLGIKLATKGRVSLVDFERAVTSIPEVQSVQHVLGLYDYRLKVVSKDLSDFERVLRRRIMNLPGVGNVEANVLLSEERRVGPLEI